MRRYLVAGLVLALLAVACSDDEATSSLSTAVASVTTAGSWSPGPTVDADQDEVITSATWVDPLATGPSPSPPVSEGAVVLEITASGTAVIAVNGGGCVPDARLAVLRGPPSVELEITLAEAIPPPGLQCSDLLRTHALQVQLASPTEVREVVVVVVGSA